MALYALLVSISILLVVLLVMLPDRIAPSGAETVGRSARPSDTTDSAGSRDADGERKRSPEQVGDGATPEPTEESPADDDSVLFPAIGEHGVLGTIYVVLDDAGYDLDQLRPFLDVPGDLAIAVLPQLPDSREAARMVHNAGKTVMLHLPMEPVGGADPGPGAILMEMSEQEITDLVRANLASVPGAVGVNNHMGSRATADERVMETVIREVDRHGLFFVDSRTSAETVGALVASRLGVAHAERHVFLDNDRDRDSLIAVLRTVVDRAATQETVVAIGHVTTPGLAGLLTNLHDELAAHGHRLGSLHDLLPARLARE